MNQRETLTLEAQIVEQLRTCFDPEIPVNIYDLGLIYAIAVAPAGAVHVTMTLTSPGCPAAGSLPGAVKTRVADSPGVTDVQVDVVWDPPWDPSMMSEDARLELGLL
jgi:FeS assembly SUF system protein